jgi:hypothetical protein
MDTSAGYYQAPRPPRVPLDEVLIKLHPEGFHQEFEADAINVGTGGLSMRASVLPQVGSTLRCQLDNPSGGEAIEMIGRVVWAHESGEHAGEFGIRFTHLSSEDQTRIEALIQRWGRSSAKAPTVTLQLDGVDSTIVAELRSESDTALTVEQPLPFLAIGSGMLNASAGRRGRLEAVELSMDAETPKLVLSIGYEVSDGGTPRPAEEAGRDTMPDEPPVIRTSRPSGELRMSDTPRIVRYDKAEEDTAQVSIGDRVRAYTKAAADQLASSVRSARSAATEGFAPRVAAATKDFIALMGRFLGALRSRLDEKPRRQQVPRSQAARAHLKNTRRSRRRYLVLVAMVAAIVASGWGVYVWAADSVTDPASESEAAEVPAAVQEPASAAAPARKATPANDEVIPLQGPPPPPEAVRGTAFGADAVPHGETYVLRMSNPVVEMDGIVEEDGFSVTIPGSLSLSRAGPIAAAHPDVEHASILNRGDFSELTIRFVAGRSPTYRVEARGPAVEITISR